MKLSDLMQSTMRSPIMAARSWVDEIQPPVGKPLIDLSQAAPAEPPHPALRNALAVAANGAAAHYYGNVLGNDDLRTEIASKWSAAYGAEINAQNVGVTAGCNQAFCAALASVASPGDSVILATPFYFNHAMRMRYAGITAHIWDVGPDLIPDPSTLAGIYDESVRAIVMVTPNNPTGAEYPAETLLAVYEFARSRGIALILDETYKDFRQVDGAPHSLFQQSDWPNVLTHLYSFSKAYRITGHRAGAIVAGTAVLDQVEKYLDCETICASQLAQTAALFGLQHLDDDVAAQRRDVENRRQVVVEQAPTWTDWEVMSCGAYFAFLRHPYDASSTEVAQALLRDAGILMLPGAMFAPEGSQWAQKTLRMAFANIGPDDIREMSDRLKEFIREQDVLKRA